MQLHAQCVVCSFPISCVLLCLCILCIGCRLRHNHGSTRLQPGRCTGPQKGEALGQSAVAEGVRTMLAVLVLAQARL